MNASALSTAAEPFARIRELQKYFANGTLALSGLNLTIDQGTFLSLLGPSGCGKSTVLRILAGLTAPSAGSIEFSEKSAIGYVFQEPTLLPWCNVLKNVMLPLRLRNMPRSEAIERGRSALASVGLADFSSHFPRQLSGGMKMRVSIARAIVTRPKVLLLDEPFASLDEFTRFNLNNDLLRLWSDERFTAVFVTHSVSEAVYLSQKVCIMAPRPGRVVSDYLIDIPAGERTADIRTTPLYNQYVRDIGHRLQIGLEA